MRACAVRACTHYIVTPNFFIELTKEKKNVHKIENTLDTL